MKKNKKTRLIIEISLLLIFILSITALTTSAVQTFLAKYAASYISETIGTELTIDRLSISYLSNIELDNVTLKDKQGENLASLGKVKVKIRLFPLFNGKVVIKHAIIDNLDANIYITPDSTTNFQFIIDAFPTDTTSTTPDISIQSIALNNAKIRYRDWRDSTDLDLRHINTDVKFEINKSKEIQLEVKGLNLCNKEEKVLNDFKAKALINDKMLGIRNVEIRLRNSLIKLDAAKIDFAFKNGKEIDLGNSAYMVNLSPSTIIPEDIGWIVPQVRGINSPVHFELDASGKIDNIKTQKIRLDYDESIVLNASINVEHITNLDSLHAELNIEELRFSSKAVNSLINKTGNRRLSLPKELDNLGACNYKGTISGEPSNIELIGDLTTAQGNLYTNVKVSSTDTFKTFDLTGKLNSSTIHLNRIINNPELGLGPTEFRVETNAHFNGKGKFDITLSGNIDKATFKNYTYRNIELNGLFSNKKFTGTILLDDPNGKLQFDGMLDMSEAKKKFTLTSNIEKVKPWELHLIENNKETSISFGIAMDLTLTNANDINGTLSINDIDIANQGKDFHLKTIELKAVNNNDTNFIDIRSGIINGSIYGHFKTSDIVKNLVKTLSKNLPRLKNLNIGVAKEPTDITISFDIEPLERLMKSIEIPWYTKEAATCHLSYKSERDRISSYIIVPNITNGNTTLNNTLLNINNYNGVNLRLKTETDLRLGHVAGTLNVKMDHGVITTSLNWEDIKSGTMEFGGEMLVKTTFTEKDNNWNSDIEILPTQFILHGTPWSFGYSKIQISNDKVGIDNFSLSSEDGQTIAIDGNISDRASDTLNVSITDLMLEYISEMMPRDVALSFGGRLSAQCEVTQLMSNDPHINLDATSIPFIFNESELGQMKANCNFNPKKNNLDFYAQVYSSADTSAVLDGHYFFTRDSLDIMGKANGLDLSFINYFIKDVFGTVSGKGYGDVHIYSSEGGNVAVDVDALAKDASIGVNFLNTKYFFTDTIRLRKDIIDFGEIALTDELGKRGKLEGNIKHNYFKDMVLNLGIHCDTMLVMNTTKKESSSFYGKVLATGDIHIKGPTENISITGKARTEPQTKIYLPIDNYTATENSFVTFIETKQDDSEEEPTTSNSNLSILLMIDIAPQTEATIITNSKTGDRLDAKLSGNLQMSYDVNNSDIKLSGGLNVLSGLYVFTLQEVIRKEFKFKEGGKITWSGDPLNAKLDIEGYYQLNANIADLLSEADLVNVARTTVPVQCQLIISGNLIQPTINFNIELPSSDEEIKMAVKKAIDTPEKLYREVIALLLLGKFIKAESMDNSSFISQNEIYSAVSSTISAQINNWASQMFDHWGFGVNFRKTDDGKSTSKEEFEYEFNFQYTPTDRILINGNVGYRDNSSNSNNFIGDFDFEYKLVESGQLRIKAYTHTNDYKELKKGLRTQGVGLLWTENFNNAKDLNQIVKTQIERGKIERQQRKETRKKKKEERAKKKEEKKAQKTLEKERKKAEKKK